MSVENQLAAKRVTITLPHQVFMDLVARAELEGRSTSNLAAFLLECSLAVPKENPADRRLGVDSGQRENPPSDNFACS